MSQENDPKSHAGSARPVDRLRKLLGDAAAPSAASNEKHADIPRALAATELADIVPIPLLTFDRQGTILFANAAARGAFGADAGMSLHMRFRAPAMHDLLAKVTEEASLPQTIDYVERLPVERVYHVTASRVGHGDATYVMVFEEQSEARRIDRMRADFIANASHELRTPLASIAGFIETLRGPAQDDKAARERFLAIMQEQTQRMARLIDDLLSLSRVEVKPYLKPTSRVDIVALVAGVADQLSHMAAEAGITVERDLPEGGVMVAGNRDELVQVFTNLIENACKYGASGKRVVVSAARAADGGSTVTVRDFGPGIAEEHIPRITERFYRVDVETSRRQRGTGLGLSIVRHILARHDARLSITSRLGEGAAFTVHFPPP